MRYDADPATASLTWRDVLTLPLDIQYAWPHPSLPVFYLAISNGGPGRRGDVNQLVACRIDPVSGSLSRFGPARDVAWRPLHLSLDRDSRHLLAAYNDPSGVTVHAVHEDGSLGEAVPQRDDLDFGIFGHQIMVTPDGETAILPCRGHDASGSAAEQPGALKVFDLADGRLMPRLPVAPNDGFGFGARHLDFHPTLPVLYLAVERQSELHVFELRDGIPTSKPRQVVSAVENASASAARQAVSAIHVHPNGQTLYISNRAYGTVETGSGSAFPHGENSVTVFSVDPAAGTVSPIQHAPSGGNLPRTFSIDPSGRMLVAANSEAAPQIDAGGTLRDVPLSLATFSIAADGRLTATGKIDFPERDALLFWAGFL